MKPSLFSLNRHALGQMKFAPSKQRFYKYNLGIGVQNTARSLVSHSWVHLGTELLFRTILGNANTTIYCIYPKVEFN